MMTTTQSTHAPNRPVASLRYRMLGGPILEIDAQSRSDASLSAPVPTNFRGVVSVSDPGAPNALWSGARDDRSRQALAVGRVDRCRGRTGRRPALRCHSRGAGRRDSPGTRGCRVSRRRASSVRTAHRPRDCRSWVRSRRSRTGRCPLAGSYHPFAGRSTAGPISRPFSVERSVSSGDVAPSPRSGVGDDGSRWVLRFPATNGSPWPSTLP